MLHCKGIVPKIGKNIPKKETARGLSPNFYIHICERFIYTHDYRYAYFAAGN